MMLVRGKLQVCNCPEWPRPDAPATGLVWRGKERVTMPSIPQSLLWISLVVLWLFVLVPMLVSKRDAVRRTSDVALATRVLNSGTAARLIKRGGPAAGHRSDPDWQPDEDEYDDDLDDARRRRGRGRPAVARRRRSRPRCLSRRPLPTISTSTWSTRTRQRCRSSAQRGDRRRDRRRRGHRGRSRRRVRRRGRSVRRRRR